MKKEVVDISFQDYISLNNRSQYDYYLRYGKLKPLDYFKLGDITEQSYGFVKDMQEYLNYSGLTWINYFKTMEEYGHKINPKDSLFTLQQSRLWLKEQIEFVNKLESDGLGHTPEPDEEVAGIDMFGKYRSFMQLDKLAGGNVTKYDEVRKQPYGTCFTKLKLESDKIEYETRLNKIRTKKN